MKIQTSLVVHGGKDDRIPPEYVQPYVACMTGGGLHVRSICYADEDHVLILSASDRFHSDLLMWMNNEPVIEESLISVPNK